MQWEYKSSDVGRERVKRYWEHVICCATISLRRRLCLFSRLISFSSWVYVSRAGCICVAHAKPDTM